MKRKGREERSQSFFGGNPVVPDQPGNYGDTSDDGGGLDACHRGKGKGKGQT